MFKKSTSNNTYTYKIKKVFKSTNKTNNKPYTIFSIFSKTRKTNQIINGELIVWDDIKASEGDLIAFYDISDIDFEEVDKGYQTYKTIIFHSTNVKIIKGGSV
ncbi:MAG: hypothetical protein IKB98_05310 [Clostridia bacterium]|nr:hypothetical protein [Clostridia bacterium]